MKKIIISVLAVFLFMACETDTEPSDKLPWEGFYKTESDFDAAINGVYTLFKRPGMYYASASGEDGILVGDMLADNLLISTDGRMSNAAGFDWDYSAGKTVSRVYEYTYKAIANANKIMDQIDNLAPGKFRDNIEGEALAARALLHFEIAKSHVKIPTQSADANDFVGIAYIDYFNPTAQPSRLGTVKETYDKIIKDLELAATKIGDNNGMGRLNKAAVYGLLSRVKLYNGDWDGVIESANSSINAGATVGSRSNFPAIWGDTSEDGVLFKIRIVSVDDVTIGVNYGQGNRAEYVCDYDFYQKFKDEDIRKTTYLETMEFNKKMYNIIIKYVGGRGTANLADGKVIRGAEVYLNQAEAYYKKGQESQALTALNKVREERYKPYTAGSESSTLLWDAIILERRLELAFEGDRWYTLKRLGLPVKRSTYGHLADGTGVPAPKLNLNSSSHLWQWPISRENLIKDPKITQTPGY